MCLKAISFVKKTNKQKNSINKNICLKPLFKALFEYIYTGLDYFIRPIYFNLESMGRPDK